MGKLWGTGLVDWVVSGLLYKDANVGSCVLHHLGSENKVIPLSRSIYKI